MVGELVIVGVFEEVNVQVIVGVLIGVDVYQVPDEVAVLVAVGEGVAVKRIVGVLDAVAVMASVFVEVGLTVKVQVAVAAKAGAVETLKCLVQLVRIIPASATIKIAIQKN